MVWLYQAAKSTTRFVFPTPTIELRIIAKRSPDLGAVSQHRYLRCRLYYSNRVLTVLRLGATSLYEISMADSAR
jgi:hypothetical protein